MKHRTISVLASLALIAGALSASAQTSGGGSAGGGASGSGSTGSGSTGSGSTGSGMTGSGATGSGASGGRSLFSPSNTTRSSPSGAGATGAQTGPSTQTSPLGTTGQPDGSTGQPGQPTTGSGTDQTSQSQQTGQGQSGSSGQLPNQQREQPSALKTDPQNPEFQSSGGGKAQGSVPGGSLVALTEEERRKIRDIILKQTAAQEARANFKVMVGAKVPQEVSLRPMPQEVVNVVPKYKDFDFTIVNDRIIVVQRSTREIDTMIPI